MTIKPPMVQVSYFTQNDKQNIQCLALGYKIAETDKTIMIAQSNHDGVYNGVINISKSAILSVKSLRKRAEL